MDTPFKAFAELCRSLESTAKRLEKRRMIAAFLRSLQPGEVTPAVSFLLGRPFPESDERVLELGGTTLWKLPPSRQTTLLSGPLTIKEVSRSFDAIARASGSGSRAKKEALIEGLLGWSAPDEAPYILRIISGEMRIGAVEGVVMEAIAESSGSDLRDVQRANMLQGNLGEVATLALTKGGDAVKNVGLRLFTPIKPMLAEVSYSLKDVMARHGGVTAFEFKFDGARVQIHKKGDEIRIYSRRLSDITKSFPELVAALNEEIQATDAVVEGEAIALGDGGRPLPFQDLMRRFRRVNEVDEARKRIPVRLFLFDILYKDGAELISKPYEERWNILEHVAPQHILTPRIITGSVKEAESFLDNALRKGHEGLMAKSLKSTYTPGARQNSWLKIKPFETLDLVIIAAEWGYGRRRGWLSNYHLGALADSKGEYVMLGKTFKGLTDDEFKSMTRRLLASKVGEERNGIAVKPSIVVEVGYNEIQRSRRYGAGFALRFARILRIREDKSPLEADTVHRIQELYNLQFKKKALLAGPKFDGTEL